MRKNQWKDVASIGMVLRTREVNGKLSEEVVCYLSSLPPKVKTFARAVRSHWGIENRLHWSLDVTFHEDDIRIYDGYAAENLATVRKIALNALKQERTRKLSLKNKRALCAMKSDYLMQVLTCIVSDVS